MVLYWLAYSAYIASVIMGQAYDMGDPLEPLSPEPRSRGRGRCLNTAHAMHGLRPGQ